MTARLRVSLLKPPHRALRLAMPVVSRHVPRVKRDYVEAIAGRCNVPMGELEKHDVPRLKEMWAVLKPKSRQPVLATGWKKANLDALREIYLEMVAPDLDRDVSDKHYHGWKRAQFLLEIDLWVTEKQEADLGDQDCSPTTPLCATCMIPMIRRTNRLTKEDFYGCIRYPMCRECLPLSYAGQPAEVMQAALLEQKSQMTASEKASTKSKRKGMTGGENQGGLGTSTESLEMEPRINVNVTEAEMAKILQDRQLQSKTK